MVKTKKVKDLTILLNFKNIAWIGIWTALAILLWRLGLKSFVYKLANNTSATTVETGTIKNDSDKYIVFQNLKVSKGEYLYLPRPVPNYHGYSKQITKSNEALFIIDIDNDSVVVRGEDGKEETIRDKSCLTISQNGPVIVTDIFYKYCFSLSTLDSVLNISYELMSESWNGGKY